MYEKIDKVISKVVYVVLYSLMFSPFIMVAYTLT